jgi:hypothetical protein
MAITEVKTHNVIWDDIIFVKDKISFNVTRLKTILPPVTVKGVVESLNLVKDEYFNRLYGKQFFKLGFGHSGLLTNPSLSPGWNRLLDAIELVQEHYEIRKLKRKKGVVRRNNNISPHDLVELYEGLLSRTEYLKWLANHLDPEFRLIPVLEYANGKVEDSFLFRIRNKNGNILLIWENVHVSRATYIFKFSEQKQDEVLKKIEDFICTTDFEHKRSILSSDNANSKKLKLELGFLKKYSHENISDFKAEVAFLISSTV